MLLTQNSGAILGPIAKLLGFIMNAIFEFCTLLTIPSIGLTIILFTIVVYMLLLPLTIKQQKFSKFSAKMNPELQAVQKKYKDKKDQASQLKMNEETQAVYAKYGVSPMGTCLPLLIQMPILFALYRVIYNIPGYVQGVKDAFIPLAENILSIKGSQEFLAEFASANRINFESLGYGVDSIIDCLYKFKPENWQLMMDNNLFSGITDNIASTQNNIDQMNYFLGINIGNSPSAMFMDSITGGVSILGIIAALSIPVLAGASQWLSVKFSQSASNAPQASGEMANSMKTMNNVMPLMSVFFCFTLPAGMGLYWIAGAVIRCIQQVIINKHLDKIDIDALLEKNAKKNLDKQNKRREKMGLPPQKISDQAKVNVRNIQTPAPQKKELTEEEKKEQIEKSTEYYNQTSPAKPGSIAAKARMVEQYNEKKKK